MDERYLARLSEIEGRSHALAQEKRRLEADFKEICEGRDTMHTLADAGRIQARLAEMSEELPDLELEKLVVYIEEQEETANHFRGLAARPMSEENRAYYAGLVEKEQRKLEELKRRLG